MNYENQPISVWELTLLKPVQQIDPLQASLIVKYTRVDLIGYVSINDLDKHLNTWLANDLFHNQCLSSFWANTFVCFDIVHEVLSTQTAIKIWHDEALPLHCLVPVPPTSDQCGHFVCFDHNM